MNKVTNTLQSLVFGDRFTFILDAEEDITNQPPSVEDVSKILFKLESKGYMPRNPELLFRLNKRELIAFKNDFTALIKNSTKEGVVLRSSFFNSEFPTDYTDREWEAIFAQYALTYGWSNSYKSIKGEDAEQTFSKYVNSMSSKKLELGDTSEVKLFKLGNIDSDLLPVIKSILESKSVLRTQQIKTIKNCSQEILAAAAKSTNIPIKETLTMIMSILRGFPVDFPILKTAQDVLRYIILVFAEQPIEGQIQKKDLKTCKIHIPTADRKALVNNLELIATRAYTKSVKNNPSEYQAFHITKGERFLCEGMFNFDSYWKLIHRYLRWEPEDKMRSKYPLYKGAIDLLYINDRSWTFNGRYSAAKEEANYASAIKIASEQPGFMLRNMLEFMRMIEGVKVPKKAKKLGFGGTSVSAKEEKTKTKTVQTDALSFLESDTFVKICDTKLNTKLAFQLLEQMEDPSNNAVQKERMVQGSVVKYTIPVPALNTKAKQIVSNQLKLSISKKLHNLNKGVKSIYIDPDVMSYSLQYSGRSATEISYNGEFMSKNSIIPFSDLGSKNIIIRLGVMWRSTASKPQSIDIDHNVTLITGTQTKDVYYGKPVYKDSRGSIVAASSGDITMCGDHTSKFSVELVDLNLDLLKRNGFKGFYNSFIDFGSRTSIGALECYTFMQILKTKTVDAKRNINNISIDLAQTDYAIRIDPDNTDNTGSYIGLYFDLEKETVEVLAIPIKDASGTYSNIKVNKATFNRAIKNRVQPFTLGEALQLAFTEDQIVSSAKDAELVISRKNEVSPSITVLHPGKDGELINEMLFT